MNGTKERCLLTVLFFLFLAMAPLPCSGAIPERINYQGFLTDSAGVPVNIPVTMSFAIYVAATEGTPLWTETRSVAVSNGYYSVDLGELNPLRLPFDRPYFLGVRVGSDAEMLPRQPLASVAYAYRSAVADSANSVADGSITSGKIGINCLEGQVLQRTATGWACGSVSTGGTGGGSITGVTAGPGLLGGGVAGNVALDVSFAGSGSAASAARSDHDHDAVYRKKYAKVAVVAQSGGDYNSPLAALADLAAWCGTPAAVNPCLVRIMPGVYSLGEDSLQMQSYVDVRGSGENSTVLAGNIGSFTAGVVNGAANTELASLTIRNSGGSATDGSMNPAAIAVYNKNAAPRIANVAAYAAGAAANFAIYNDASSPVLREVSAAASGGTNSYAVYNRTSGTMVIRGSTLDADTNTIFNGDGVTTYVADTKFSGKGVIASTGILTCAGVYDGEYNFFPNTCPPFVLPPLVLATIPSQSSNWNIPTNTVVSATFNNDMNPATITTATFTLRDSSGAAVAGTVTYDTAARTAAFVPQKNLAPNSAFTAVVKSGVRDLTGKGLAADYQWSIMTANAADTAPPTVQSATPADKAVNVDRLAPITVHFNKQIDPRTMNGSTFMVRDGSGNPVSGKYGPANSYSGGYSYEFSMQPSAPLAYNTTYTATLTSGVKDTAGNPLASYSWSFSTPAGAAPADVNASAAGRQATVTWQLVAGATAYNLYWATAPFGSLGYSGNTPPVITKVPNVTSPHIHTGLAEGTMYYYSVTAVGASGESGYGNVVSVLIDTVSPTIRSVTPASNSVIDPASLMNGVYVSFSEGLNSATVNSDTFKVTDAAGSEVAGSVGYNGSTSYYEGSYGNINFYPTSPLRYNTTYTATVTTGVKDFAGNSLAAPYSWSFSTIPAGTPSLNLAKNGDQVTLTWPSTGGATSYNLYWSTFYGVTKNNGIKIPNVTGPYVHAGLASGTTYYYVLTALNGTTEGVASNQVLAVIDTVPPTVTAVTPANNTTGVSIDSYALNLRVNFSKNIDSATVTSTTFTLKDGAGNPVNGSFNTWSNNLQFTPSSSLAYGTTYSATVTTGVKDLAGNPLASSYSWSFTTSMAPPAGLAVTRGNLTSNLTWNAVAGATSYNVYWSTSPGVTKASGIKIAGITSPSYSHSGLADGSTYYYVVTAVSVAGESATSSEAWVKFDGIPPTVDSVYPTGTNVDPNASSVRIDFSETVSGVTINTTNISLTDSNGNPVPFSFNTSGDARNVYLSLSTRLKFNTTYTARVTTGIKDLAGNFLPSDYTWSFTTMSPAIPTWVTATPGNGQVTIGWQTTYGAAAYNIYWSTSPGVTKTNGTKITGVVSPYIFTGLTAGTTYYFVVTAIYGDTESAESAEVNSLGIAAPSYAWASNSGGVNHLTWYSVTGATSYNIYWSTVPGVTRTNGTKIANVAGTAYDHTGLAAGTTYYYVITAVSGTVESGTSMQVSATTAGP